MIKIIVDSASDFEVKEAEQLGITVIPIQVNFGDEEYLDGENLSHQEFFEKLISNKVFPKTSQINEFRFNEYFEKSLVSADDQILCITMSSKLSGTYNSAVTASQKYNGRVKVVDSLNAALGEKILVEYAINLVKSGTSLDEIETKLNEKKKNIKLLALVGTLEYLKKGGRISSFTAFAGTLLNIKPVISIVNGEVKMIGKAKGSKNGYKMLNEFAKKDGGIDYEMPFTTAYSGLNDNLLQQYLEDNANIWKDKTNFVPKYLIGSTIGSHFGPDGIGVAFFSKDKK